MSKIGDVNINKQGVKMTIVEYNGCQNIKVKFEDGLIRNTTANNFRKGEVLNYNLPTVYNKGYLGNKENTIVLKSLAYSMWHGMLRRCYNNEEKFKAYKGCEVCEEWLNFQNFKIWFDKNYWECGNERMCLDKDIMTKGNKIYSPNTCLIVPQKINVIFVRNYIRNRDYPNGVYKCGKGLSYTLFQDNKRITKYIAQITQDNINFAFNEYKKTKEHYIKQVADLYKAKYPNFPQRLYDAMYNYQVEITD